MNSAFLTERKHGHLQTDLQGFFPGPDKKLAIIKVTYTAIYRPWPRLSAYGADYL